MTNNKVVSIIIVNYNGKDWLKPCLDSILDQSYPHFEIILVDNASSDKSISIIKKSYKFVRIVINNSNIGFSSANNVGVKNSSGEILFFLNNDTRIFSKAIEKLIAYKDFQNLNIIGPRVLNEKKKDLLALGKYMGTDFLGYPGQSRKLFYVDGCAMMISRTDFEKLGGFDEKYFMYSEDIDLCWRAHLYGMKIGVCQDTAVIHFGGGSSETTMYEKGEKHIVPVIRRYEVEKNTLRNILKNYHVINLLWVIPIFLIQYFCESLIYLVSGNFEMILVLYRAIIWNICNINDTIYLRRIVQKQRVVSDNQILPLMDFSVNKLKAFFHMGIPRYI